MIISIGSPPTRQLSLDAALQPRCFVVRITSGQAAVQLFGLLFCIVVGFFVDCRRSSAQICRARLTPSKAGPFSRPTASTFSRKEQSGNFASLLWQ